MHAPIYPSFISLPSTHPFIHFIFQYSIHPMWLCNQVNDYKSSSMAKNWSTVHNVLQVTAKKTRSFKTLPTYIKFYTLFGFFIGIIFLWKIVCPQKPQIKVWRTNLQPHLRSDIFLTRLYRLITTAAKQKESSSKRRNKNDWFHTIGDCLISGMLFPGLLVNLSPTLYPALPLF